MTATRSPEEFERIRDDAGTVTDAVTDEPRPGAEAPHGRAAIRVEDLAWLFVLMVAALFRFASLATVPLSAAEGARALETWSVAQGRLPAGWPGSIVDAGTLAVFRLFGSGDAAARLLPALAGVLLVAAFWLLRPFVGRVPALAAALLAAVSPMFVLDARGVGGDALGAALALLLASLVLRFLDAPRPRLFVAICVATSFGLATDAVFLGSVALIGVWLALRGAWRRDDEFAAAWQVVRGYQDWWRSAAPLSLAGLLLATSRFGVGFARLRPAALRSWALAFTPSRPGVPWHYPLDVLGGYELPLVLLAAAGVFLVVRERHRRLLPVHALLLTWLTGGVLLNLFMAGRFASSLLLTLVPAALFAGLAVEYLVRECA
ncbi:MAG: glycosyltransferase family 39 protein, partial [Dehalococcoidia bacterium]